MMQRMDAPPIVIRDKGKDAASHPRPIVGLLRLEEGAVAAIVLENEDTHQKQSGRNRQQQGQPVAYLQAKIHHVPEDKIRHQSGDDLPDAFADARPMVLGHNIDPGWFIVFLFWFYC